MLQNETTSKITHGNSEVPVRRSEHHSINQLPVEFLIERMVHKLRNQLSVITTATGQLEDSVNEKLTDEDRYFFSAVQHGAEKLNEILTRMAVYGSSKADEMDQIDPVELMHEAIKQAKENQIGKDDLITIELQDPGDLPPISCCPGQIMILFEEILLNAIESIAGAGTVSIAFRIQGEKLTVSIADTGEGISPDIWDRVFLPFVTDKPGYTGLGLALASRMAELNRADLEMAPGSAAGMVVSVIFHLSPRYKSDS